MTHGEVLATYQLHDNPSYASALLELQPAVGRDDVPSAPQGFLSRGLEVLEDFNADRAGGACADTCGEDHEQV